MRTILRKGCTQHRKIAILLQFRAIDTHDPTKGFIQHKRNRNFTTVSCDRHARSYERVLQSTSPVLLCTTKYYSSTSTTKTSTSSTSTTSGSKMSILLQFRAIDTQDLMKGFIQQIQNRQITTVSCDRCVRSYERVAPSTAKSQFYYSFARSIRTILRKGSSSTNEIAILLQFRAIDTHDPTKGFIQQKQNRNFTTVSRDPHARSYERVHPAPAVDEPLRKIVRVDRAKL